MHNTAVFLRYVVSAHLGAITRLYARTDERNNTVVYITLGKEICSFIQMYRIGKKMHLIGENNVK
jgi:hypothetical protein